MTFKQKLQSMTGKQIMQAMIDGIKKEHVKIDMNTFGETRIKKGKEICYGCAATNTICELSEKKFSNNLISDLDKHAEALGWKGRADQKLMFQFEYAINALRLGDVDEYNVQAKTYGFPEIKKLGIKLKTLSNYNYKKNLACYQEYCNLLPNE